MSLHRIDQLVVDDHGRAVRRATRYVDRRASGSPARVVMPAPIAPIDGGTADADENGRAIDLEDTGLARDLRQAVSTIADNQRTLREDLLALSRRLDTLAARPPPSAAPVISADIRGALGAAAQLEDRVGKIEAALGALGAAAAVTANQR